MTITSRLDQFGQLVGGPVWDGNLISKTDRDALVTVGWVARTKGWNFLTTEGVTVAVELGLLRA